MVRIEGASGEPAATAVVCACFCSGLFWRLDSEMTTTVVSVDLYLHELLWSTAFVGRGAWLG